MSNSKERDFKLVEKYVLLINDCKIGILFRQKTGRIIIGGFMKHRSVIQNLITSYFLDHVPNHRMSSRNKIKYEFSFSLSKLDKVVKDLEEHSFTIQRVNSLGRIMR